MILITWKQKRHINFSFWRSNFFVVNYRVKKVSGSRNDRKILLLSNHEIVTSQMYKITKKNTTRLIKFESFLFGNIMYVVCAAFLKDNYLTNYELKPLSMWKLQIDSMNSSSENLASSILIRCKFQLTLQHIFWIKYHGFEAYSEVSCMNLKVHKKSYSYFITSIRVHNAITV